MPVSRLLTLLFIRKLNYKIYIPAGKWTFCSVLPIALTVSSGGDGVLGKTPTPGGKTRSPSDCISGDTFPEISGTGLVEEPGFSEYEGGIKTCFFDFPYTIRGFCTSKTGLTSCLDVEGTGVGSAVGKFFKISMDNSWLLVLFQQ